MTRRHLITGAGSGIGAAVANRLLERGDHLVLLARHERRAADLQAQYAGCQTIVADLADPGLLNGVGRQLDGPLDSVIHCAGVVTLSPVASVKLHDLEEQLAVNLMAPAVLTRECLPALREARGVVVFVNSTAGLSANAGWSAYAASKAGLISLADALRAEEPQIRVSTVYPSRTATAMQASVHEQEHKEYAAGDWMSAETVAAAIVDVLDLPRDATITDVTVRTAR